jgi:hypothetical protein
MKYLFIIICVLMPTMILADSPPAWETNYTIESLNKKFSAEITPKKIGLQGKPWKWEYQVTVKDRPTKTQLWTQNYRHTGYSGGMLSNDGNFFVHIETFYSPIGSLITVYSRDKIKSLNAFNLSISPFSLPKSVSHKLWLDPEKPPSFIEKNGKIVGLQLETYKGKREIYF